jgi:hypothetical protein
VQQGVPGLANPVQTVVLGVDVGDMGGEDPVRDVAADGVRVPAA